MSTPASTMQPVLIIGAGVSGLTIAQGLRLRSIPFRLFERRPSSLTAEGHRFRLSKEALDAIRTVLSPTLQYLFDKTAAQANKYKSRYVDAQEFRFDPAALVEEEDSKPIDRSWLRSLLSLGIEDSIEYEKELNSITTHEAGHISAHFTDGTTATGSLLIGADGVHSAVRRQLQPDRKLLDLERYITWGRTPLTQDLQSRLSKDAMSWYMVQDHNTNIQAVIEPMLWTPSSRNAALEAGLPSFEDYIYWCICTPHPAAKVPETWHPELQLVFKSAPSSSTACLPVPSSRPDIELEVSALTGMVTLVGDAAHVMSPMGGSGASTAVMNAVDLVETIAERGSLREFEGRMSARAKERILHSFEGGKKFWKGKEFDAYQDYRSA